jgi:hypothetical protein
MPSQQPPGSEGEQTADASQSSSQSGDSGSQGQAESDSSVLDSTAGQGDSSERSGESGELVFEEGMGEGESQSEALPDFSEEETLEASMEGFEDAMETAAADAQGQTGEGFPGQEQGQQQGESGDSSQQGQAGEGARAGGSAGAEPGSQTAGTDQAGGTQSGGTQPGGSQSGSGYGGGRILTDAEQVAILDEQLNRGTADFDGIILEEREVIRRTAGNASGDAEDEAQAGGGVYGGSGGAGTGGFEVPPMAGGGGGGMGGAEPRPDYDQEMPEQVAVYAPPADIPDGTDDDVVARQLREAAMREPDPELREKLWDEYRKYKGID